MKLSQQKGSAMVMVMSLTVLMSLFVSGMFMTTVNQKQFNRRSGNFEKAIWVAETAVQRAVSGLKHNNDGMTWDMRKLTAKPAGAGSDFWFWEWHTLTNENGKPWARYWVEVLSPENKNKLMRLKVVAQVFDRMQDGKPYGAVQRAIGVEIKQITLGDFAIASNHQLGGARINGGARIYGGIFTSGHLHLDASSTGIYNEYLDLQTSQNFGAYPVPSASPDAQVFVYKDTVSPAPTNDGMITLASQSVLGTSTSPMHGIHTAEDDPALDPGDGSPNTVGDGIIGNGEGKVKGKKDHKLPSVNFPDASKGSAYMNERKAEATAASAVYSGDVTFDQDIAIGSSLFYDSSNNTLTINGPVYIEGNVNLPANVKYTGKGALFVEGDVQAPKGLEPLEPSGYPATHAMALVSTGDMQLGTNSGSSVKFAGTFFGNRSVQIQKAKIFGNLFGNTVNLPTTGTRPDIYVHPEVRDEVGVPLPDFTNAELAISKWWEMSGNASKTSNP